MKSIFQTFLKVKIVEFFSITLLTRARLLLTYRFVHTHTEREREKERKKERKKEKQREKKRETNAPNGVM